MCSEGPLNEEQSEMLTSSSMIESIAFKEIRGWGERHIRRY